MSENIIELKRKRFKFKLDGNVYELKSPNVSMIQAYTANQKKLEKNKDEDAVMNAAMDFLADLGMPKDISSTLEMDHLESIITNVTGQKKS